MGIFKRKTPILFQDILQVLADESVVWTCDAHTIYSGTLRIWIANRPYADMTVNGAKPPRWFAKKMRPLTDAIRGRAMLDSVKRRPNDP